MPKRTKIELNSSKTRVIKLQTQFKTLIKMAGHEIKTTHCEVHNTHTVYYCINHIFEFRHKFSFNQKFPRGKMHFLHRGILKFLKVSIPAKNSLCSTNFWTKLLIYYKPNSLITRPFLELTIEIQKSAIFRIAQCNVLCEFSLRIFSNRIFRKNYSFCNSVQCSECYFSFQSQSKLCILK